MTPRPSLVVPILLYHSISDSADRQDRPYTVSPATFARHAEMIALSGRQVLTVGELADARRTGRDPVAAVVITCDDGYADTRELFAETLLNLGVRATVYVSTGTIDDTVRHKRMISWAAVRELAGVGFEIGSHGHHHLQLDTTRKDLVIRELRQSRELLEDHLGAPTSTFAYPHGYHTAATVGLVRQAGFDSACAVKNAFSHRGDDLFALSRLTISRDVGPERLAAILRGEGPVAVPRRRPITRAWRVARLVSHVTALEVHH